MTSNDFASQSCLKESMSESSSSQANKSLKDKDLFLAFLKVAPVTSVKIYLSGEGTS